MADEYLNENLEETTEPTVEETVVEEPIDEEMMVVPEEMPPQRVNPFCVVSKNTFGEYNVRDIQTNGAWGSNPYGDDYAVVPDDMVTAIMETRGFCDIELNEDGTEIVGFTALEIPEIPVPEPEPTVEDRVEELEVTVAEQAESTEASIADIENAMCETDVVTDERIASLEDAICELSMLLEA